MTSFTRQRNIMGFIVLFAATIGSGPQLLDSPIHNPAGKAITTLVASQQVIDNTNGPEPLTYLEGDILFGHGGRVPGNGSVYS